MHLIAFGDCRDVFGRFLCSSLGGLWFLGVWAVYECGVCAIFLAALEHFLWCLRDMFVYKRDAANNAIVRGAVCERKKRRGETKRRRRLRLVHNGMRNDGDLDGH